MSSVAQGSFGHGRRAAVLITYVMVEKDNWRNAFEKEHEPH